MQPLSSYVSSVTEIVSEKLQSCDQSSDEPTEQSSESAGGMFAGVGHFPSTSKKPVGSAAPTIQARPESVLR